MDCCCPVGVCELDWYAPEGSDGTLGAPDLIIGSDLVYDPALLPPLTSTLSHLLEKDASLTAILACTIRTEDTFETFVDLAGAKGLAVETLWGEGEGKGDGETQTHTHGHYRIQDDVTTRVGRLGEHRVAVIRVTRSQ